jgi:hypothetical protein
MSLARLWHERGQEVHRRGVGNRQCRIDPAIHWDPVDGGLTEGFDQDIARSYLDDAGK